VPSPSVRGGPPNLFFEVFDHTIHAEQVAPFLADLHRRLGALTVVGIGTPFTTSLDSYGRGWRSTRVW